MRAGVLVIIKNIHCTVERWMCLAEDARFHISDILCNSTF